MTIYYRFSDQNSPMSDWGHAMFAEDRDSADAYDTVLVCWLWDEVLYPSKIMAVRTSDGAICFDESLIKRV